jgi:transposase
VAIEAVRGEARIAELVIKYGMRQTMISTWKRQVIEGMAGAFSGKAEVQKAAEKEGKIKKLHSKIG